MPQIFKPAAMAFAAASLTVAVPSSAAELPAKSAPAYTATTGDMVFEHRPKHKRKHWKRGHRNDRYDRYDRYEDRRYNDRYSYRGSARPYYMNYDRNYGQPVRRDTRIWRGDDGRYYCRRDNGTTGLLVGAGVGALLGHEVAGRGGDRTLGAIIGGAAGALLGRTIDRSSTRCG
ncbi:glycine zipper 2TM domain-containing protein [Erythrobacter litoralis]|uniref:glycine zipper 2TM domain-containing protein n=1 Tax=Erythrobacter litoralis TaxID=39960 RepID=UPI002435FD04|nr:glycine zipper 2TM domain-containing protein [Erythrobacter litoralis]